MQKKFHFCYFVSMKYWYWHEHWTGHDTTRTRRHLSNTSNSARTQASVSCWCRVGVGVDVMLDTGDDKRLGCLCFISLYTQYNCRIWFPNIYSQSLETPNPMCTAHKISEWQQTKLEFLESTYKYHMAPRIDQWPHCNSLCMLG